MTFYSKRWKYSSAVDIYDALGENASYLAEAIADEHITDFSPLFKSDSIRNNLPSWIRVVILMNKCGIRAKLPFSQGLINRISRWVDVIPIYFRNLYAKLTVDPSSLITVISSDICETIQELFAKELAPYPIMLDPSLAVHIVNNAHNMDAMIAVVKSLERINLEKVFKLAPNLYDCNETYLYIVASLVERGDRGYLSLLQSMMQQLGIYDPTGNPASYIIKHLASYPEALKLRKTLARPLLQHDIKYTTHKYTKTNTYLTDYDIITECKCIMPYVDYASHLTLRDHFNTGKKVWFVPTDKWLREKNITETSLTYEEVSDTYVIAHGHKNSYVFFSLYEIEHAIGDYAWQLPNFPDKPTLEDVDGLKVLLQRIGKVDLLEIIEAYFRRQIDAWTYNPSSPYREFFHIIVSIGLYARRWKGPGHEFPYARNAADVKDVNPEVGMLPLIAKCKEIMRQWNTTPSFKGYILKGPVKNDFLRYIEEVFRGNECIRVASSVFIHTGVYYLDILYRDVYRDPVNGAVLDTKKLNTINPYAPEE